MAIEIDKSAVYQFADFHLDVKNEELSRNGRLVKLPPQPFRVLALLVSCAGELVTRGELESSVWGVGTTVDFQQGLNSCVLQLREALSDSAKAPRFIETVPRRGYKFIAPMQQVRSAIGAAGGAPSLSAALVPTKLGRLLPAGAVIAALLLLATYAGRHLPGRAEASAGRTLVAVLPFQDLSDSTTEDAFADGLTDEVISLLGRPSPDRVGVIARTSIVQYKDTQKHIREIGRELGVRYILEGTVRRQGDRARISAQLVRVGDQAYLWCQSYDRKLESPLEVQKEVGNLIARSAGLFLGVRHQATYLPGLEPGS